MLLHPAKTTNRYMFQLKRQRCHIACCRSSMAIHQDTVDVAEL